MTSQFFANLWEASSTCCQELQQLIFIKVPHFSMVLQKMSRFLMASMEFWCCHNSDPLRSDRSRHQHSKGSPQDISTGTIWRGHGPRPLRILISLFLKKCTVGAFGRSALSQKFFFAMSCMNAQWALMMSASFLPWHAWWLRSFTNQRWTGSVGCDQHTIYVNLYLHTLYFIPVQTITPWIHGIQPALRTLQYFARVSSAYATEAQLGRPWRRSCDISISQYACESKPRIPGEHPINDETGLTVGLFTYPFLRMIIPMRITVTLLGPAGMSEALQVTKEFLDKQLEEYMGPDAIKAGRYRTQQDVSRDSELRVLGM